MTMPIDPETAQKLFDAGYLSEQPNVTEQQKAQLAVQEMEQSPPKQVINQKQIALDFKKQQIDKQADQLRAFQVPEADIEAKLQPERERLAEQERGFMLTGEKPMADVALTNDVQPQVAPQDQMQTNVPGMAAFDLMQQSMAMAGASGAAKAAEQSAQMAQMQTDLAEMDQANEQQRLANQAELEAKQQELATEVERVAGLKLDPNRFWANRSTGDKILAGASLLLGAFGAAGTGVNQAAKVIGNAIEQDLNMQQADIAQATRGVDKRRGILADMKARFKDDQLARYAARVAYLNDSQIKINEIANKYDSQIVKANAAKLVGELELQKQNYQNQFMQKVMAKQPVGPEANIAMLNQEQRERFVPGYGLALSKDAAKQANEAVATINSIKGNIDELIALSNKSGASFSPQDRAKAETLTSILTGQLRLPIVGPGAVSEKELELLQRIIANPTRIMSLDANNKQRLRTLRSRMDKQTTNQLRQFGLESPTDKLGFKALK